MPYTIDSYDGTTFTFNISDGTVDSTNTSLKLLGQNYRGYGEIVAEDFVHLLENFAKTTAPSNPIHGQIWYDKSTGSGAANKGYKLKFYDSASSSWKMVSNLASGTTAPGSPSVGDLWWDENALEVRLKLWDGTVWQNIGIPTDTKYTIQFVKIYDDYGTNDPGGTAPGVYHCIKIIAEDSVIAIVNLSSGSDSGVERLGFEPLFTGGTKDGVVYTQEKDADGTTPLSTAFSTISPGITLRKETGSSPTRRPVIGNFASNGIEDRVATQNSLTRPIILGTRPVLIEKADGTDEAVSGTVNDYALKIQSTANATSATGNTASGAALQVLGGASIARNLYVGGNLEVDGTTAGTLTYINSETTTIKDPIIEMGRGTDNTPLLADDNLDRGNVLWWHDGTADVTAGSFVISPATEYIITATGDTDFTAIGAADSNVGTVFTASGVGAGTGTANATANTKSGVVGWYNASEKFVIAKDMDYGANLIGTVVTDGYGTVQLGNIEGLNTTMGITSTIGALTISTAAGNSNINIACNGTGDIMTTGDIQPTVNDTDSLGISDESTPDRRYFKAGYILESHWNNSCKFDGGTVTDNSVTMTGDYNLSAGSTLEATYADLGERFASDDIYEAGTVVKLGGLEEITKTVEEEDTDVFGIISAKPGFGLNGLAGPKETHPHVAMTGRIPCKVIGPVKKGDRLCSSEIPGVAKKADIESVSSFAIIGRALEDFDGEGEGTVLVVVGPIN